MPPLPLEPNQFCSYLATDLPDGPRLHFLSHAHALPGTISVTVSIDFGSVHLNYPAPQGTSSIMPPGIAHFMEHFLFWLQFEDLILPMERDYIVGPNALVSYDFTRWGIRNAVVDHSAFFDQAPVDEVRQPQRVAELVFRLLQLLLPSNQLRTCWQRVLAKTRSDIGNEISARWNEPSYGLHCKLRKALYPQHPIQHDILGTLDSLRQIKAVHVQQALAVIRSQIRSVTVLGHRLSDNLCKRVATTVSNLLTRTPESVFHPVTSSTVEIVGHCRQEFFSWPALAGHTVALIGVRLLPLSYAYPSLTSLRRALVLTYLASCTPQPRLSVLLSQTARAYTAAVTVERTAAFLDSGTLTQLAQQAKVGMIERLTAFRNSFDIAAELAFSHMVDHPHLLMKLCHFADDAGLMLTDILDEWATTEADDLDLLIAELRGSSGNLALAYAGQDLNEL